MKHLHCFQPEKKQETKKDTVQFYVESLIFKKWKSKGQCAQHMEKRDKNEAGETSKNQITLRLIDQNKNWELFP